MTKFSKSHWSRDIQDNDEVHSYVIPRLSISARFEKTSNPNFVGISSNSHLVCILWSPSVIAVLIEDTWFRLISEPTRIINDQTNLRLSCGTTLKYTQFSVNQIETFGQTLDGIALVGQSGNLWEKNTVVCRSHCSIKRVCIHGTSSSTTHDSERNCSDTSPPWTEQLQNLNMMCHRHVAIMWRSSWLSFIFSHGFSHLRININELTHCLRPTCCKQEMGSARKMAPWAAYGVSPVAAVAGYTSQVYGSNQSHSIPKMDQNGLFNPEFPEHYTTLPNL